MATSPVIQASCSVMKSPPTATPPSSAKPMPSPPEVSRAGIASTRVSMLSESQGSGSTACRSRAIADLPELDPPLSTMTWVSMPPPYECR